MALAVRIKPFLYAGNFFLVPVDFDEGVYYGAGVLISKGLMPYRDFDFGHPPGIAWLLSLWHVSIPLSSVADSFALAKIAFACLGSLTTIGIYKLGKKWHGTSAGIVASLLYATYPEAIVSERSIFLEPLINAAVVASFLFLDSMKKPWLVVGLLLAWAVSVKFTAVIWILPFFCLAWQSGRIRHVLSLAAVGALGFGIFLLPWILLDPAKFWEGVIRFQLSRPPDGDVAMSLRLSSILRDQHLAMNLFTLLGLAAFPWLKESQRKLWVVMTLALVSALVVLLSSKGFWSQYNTLLALPQALLAVFALKPFARWISQRWTLTAVGLFLIAIPLRSAFKSGRARAPGQLHLIEELKKVPPTACIFSFEPGWLIMADHFPARCSGRLVLDTYLVMLMGADRLQRPFPNTAEAFATHEAQVPVLHQIRDANYLIMGERGGYQLNEQSQLEIQTLFRLDGAILYRRF
jgi:hypothetical protein